MIGVRFRPIWMQLFYTHKMTHQEIQDFTLPLLNKSLDLKDFKVNVLTPEASQALEMQLKINKILYNGN